MATSYNQTIANETNISQIINGDDMYIQVFVYLNSAHQYENAVHGCRQLHIRYKLHHSCANFTLDGGNPLY